MKEMEMQGIPVTIANLAIHRHREEEMNQERMRHNQTVQEATAERAREENKGKAREVLLDSEEESEELASSASEECPLFFVGTIPTSLWYYLYDSVHLPRSERISYPPKQLSSKKIKLACITRNILNPGIKSRTLTSRVCALITQVYRVEDARLLSTHALRRLIFI
ncbi:hypothetical protein PIB30_036656 [Stylosanthes scabra]|uniref:Uncharacterized protein n=1 Tax=Stylosanthes scabra TaxID=79078 RepID=A0ABU6VGC2_9FABA|nr:hypothetical protein [Stylosanthes scabra]